jgi:hypothetical protein
VCRCCLDALELAASVPVMQVTVWRVAAFLPSGSAKNRRGLGGPRSMRKKTYLVYAIVRSSVDLVFASAEARRILCKRHCAPACCGAATRRTSRMVSQSLCTLSQS